MDGAPDPELNNPSPTVRQAFADWWGIYICNKSAASKYPSSFFQRPVSQTVNLCTWIVQALLETAAKNFRCSTFDPFDRGNCWKPMLSLSIKGSMCSQNQENRTHRETPSTTCCASRCRRVHPSLAATGCFVDFSESIREGLGQEFRHHLSIDMSILTLVYIPR